MKTSLISTDQAFINIVSRAIQHGYKLDKYNSIEETLSDAQTFLIENLQADKQEYCEVHQSGRHQHVDYADEFGTTYVSDGEIIGWNTYRDAAPNEKYVYTTIVNVKGEVIDLYENLNLTF